MSRPGLVSMTQRATEVGGECRIDSSGNTTVVTAWLPIHMYGETVPDVPARLM